VGEFYQQQATSPIASRENQAFLAVTDNDFKQEKKVPGGFGKSQF